MDVYGLFVLLFVLLLLLYLSCCYCYLQPHLQIKLSESHRKCLKSVERFLEV